MFPQDLAWSAMCVLDSLTTGTNASNPAFSADRTRTPALHTYSGKVILNISQKKFVCSFESNDVRVTKVGMFLIFLISPCGHTRPAPKNWFGGLRDFFVCMFFMPLVSHDSLTQNIKLLVREF